MSLPKLRSYQKTIIENVEDEYRKGKKNVLVVACCGAGKSVIIGEICRRAVIKGSNVLFLVHRAELIEQIRKTLKSFDLKDDEVDLKMVQTLSRNLKKSNENYDLIITDETHHSLAKSYKKIYEHYPQAYRLGFTATPVRLNGAGLKDVYESMVEGPPVSWMIENNYLAPYDYKAPNKIDAKKLRKRAGEYTKDSVDKAIDGLLVFGDIVGHWRKFAEGKKTIVYCNSVANSERVANMFTKENIKAISLDGSTPQAMREQAISDFRNGKLDVLCNVDLFGEGFDVPDCSCVVLLRPTLSLSLYIQQAMRSMRYKVGKRAIILDHVGNCYKHGLPDSERVWSLDGRKNENDEELKVKQCVNCLSVYKASRGVCPVCKYKPPREIPKEEKILRVINTNLEDITVEDLSTFEEYHAYGKIKGYKPGWAYYQFKNKYKINIGGKRL